MTKISKILPDVSGVYCLVMFPVLVFFAGGRALLDGDTLWHITAGTEMLERGEILTSDIFSHTVYGQPWTAHEWLSEVIMGAIHEFAGLDGVVIFYFLLVVLTFWLLFKVAKLCGAGDGLAVLSVSVAFWLSLTHLLARPHVFTWFLGVLTLYLLHKGGKRVLFLPLIMVLWVNLHGGFVIGLLLQGIFVLGTFLDQPQKAPVTFIKNNNSLCVALVLSVFAVGINPFGYEQLLFPFYVSNEFFRKNVLEWHAPDLQLFWEFRYYVVFLFLAFSFGKKQISWTNRLYLLFFINAALTHLRHISIAGIFLTPFAVELLQPWEKWLVGRFAEKSSRNELILSPLSGPVATLLVGVSLLMFSAYGHSTGHVFFEKLFPLPQEYSSAAIDYIEKHPLEGKVFNYDSLGDYIIYTLGPSQKVFIDGRLDMYGEEIISDYNKIVGLKEEVDALMDKYNISWVIVPGSWPLVRYLKSQKEWEETYRDDQLSILVRKMSS